MKKLVLSLLMISMVFIVVTTFLVLESTKKFDGWAEDPISTIAPTSVPFQPHRFVFLADSRGNDGGINKQVLSKLLKKIKKLSPQPEYIIFGGDLITGSKDVNEYKSQLKAFNKCFTKYFPIEKLLPVFGNHEEYSSTEDLTHEKIFGQSFSEFASTSQLKGYNRTVYSVDISDVRLVVLNAYHVGETDEIANAQKKWFSNISKGKIASQMRKIVFIHTPPFPTGGHVGSSLDMFPKERDAFWQIIDNSNYVALFCGHEHIYSRRIIDHSFNPLFKKSVNQVIAGAAGAISMDPPFLSKKGVIVPPKSIFHFVVIDVKEKETNVRAISIKGKVIDKFTVAN